MPTSCWGYPTKDMNSPFQDLGEDATSRHMHLIFDLDGTLINSLPGIADALNASLKEHGRDCYPFETIRDFIGDGSRVLCHRAAPDAAEEVIDSLDASFKKHYQNLWLEGTSIYDGINNLLENIPSHHHLSILSNKPHQFTAEIVEKLFPADTFDTVLGQREGIAKKPDPKGIYEIIEHSCHADKTAYLIGDSTVDLQTANNAGIRSIAVTWGFEDRELLEPLSPDYIVADADALSELLHNLTNSD